MCTMGSKAFALNLSILATIEGCPAFEDLELVLWQVQNGRVTSVGSQQFRRDNRGWPSHLLDHLQPIIHAESLLFNRW